MGTAVPTMEERVKNRIGKIEIAGQIIDREAMEQARQQWEGNTGGRRNERCSQSCRIDTA